MNNTKLRQRCLELRNEKAESFHGDLNSAFSSILRTKVSARIPISQHFRMLVA